MVINEYNPFIATALKRKTVSVPTRNLIKNNFLYGNILEYGCGYGYDLKYLQNIGLSVKGYDKYNQNFNNIKILNNKYDVVFANYVFNTIPTLEEHINTINLVKNLGENVYITVRNDTRAIKTTWKYIDKYNTYWTGKSYQRFYTEQTIEYYFGEVEYINKNSSLIQFKIK